jgi:hypothetical protein
MEYPPQHQDCQVDSIYTQSRIVVEVASAEQEPKTMWYRAMTSGDGISELKFNRPEPKDQFFFMAQGGCEISNLICVV